MNETRSCQSCKQTFEITSSDFELLEKLKAPAPTWCPQCRLQRRLLWRNERALYPRKCDLCKKPMIAMFPEGTPFPVYCQSCWYSDNWDPLSYGREYDFNKNFFDQFKELLQVVPQIGVQVNDSPGSEYVNQIGYCKNCYLIIAASYDEDCMFSYRLMDSKNTLDAVFTRYAEYCYETINSNKVANSQFLEHCSDSSFISFCSDIRGSINCFMSSNLRSASYVFRNKQLTKESYENEMKKIDIGSHKQLEDLKKEFKQLIQDRLHKYMDEKNILDSTGNGLVGSSKAKHCFYGSNLDNCSYALMMDDTRDSADINNGCCETELTYEVSTVGGNVYNCKFGIDLWPEIRDTEYSHTCRDGSANLFGCVSLRKKEYCIFNKQYSKEGYEVLVEKIKKHMDQMPYTDKKGRKYIYGEFPPPEISLFAYNETPAQDYFPKTKEEATDLGFEWRDMEKRGYEVTMQPNDLPDHIRDAKDDITKEIVGCAHGGSCKHQCPAAFRITSQELKFYREQNIALPRLCPNCRHYERFALTNPFQLWKRKCQCAGVSNEKGSRKNSSQHFHGANHCPNEFETSYGPERQETVYCDKCYTSEVA